MDIEAKAIERLKCASDMSLRIFKKPLVITYSGGKDSDVLLHLAQASGIPFEVLHSLTTADAPETVRHVYDTFRRLEGKGIQCTVNKHIQPDGSRMTMWNLIPRKMMPPTRLMRYCCAELKEGGGKGRFIATGVRWAESTARKKNRGTLEVLAATGRKNNFVLLNDNDENRRLFETCQLKGERVVNPIIDWKEEDVLDYAAAEKISMNPLYCEGFRRVGCIGCPMASSSRYMEFARYPKIKMAYIRAFGRMLERRIALGKDAYSWHSGVDVFHWWMEDGVLSGQEVLDGFEEDAI
jgi:3'-phosphoadenosine 5'-phosphosulfate sulfotransferase (PAPS reductase)/FAD synthetase